MSSNDVLKQIAMETIAAISELSLFSDAGSSEVHLISGKTCCCIKPAEDGCCGDFNPMFKTFAQCNSEASAGVVRAAPELAKIVLKQAEKIAQLEQLLAEGAHEDWKGEKRVTVSGMTREEIVENFSEALNKLGSDGAAHV